MLTPSKVRERASTSRVGHHSRLTSVNRKECESRILAVQLQHMAGELLNFQNLPICFLKGAGTTQLVGFKKNASILSSTR